MKVAVLGANGFLGSNLAASLLDKGFEVWAFYRQHSDNIAESCRKVQIESEKLSPQTFDICFICIGGYDNTRQEFVKQQQTISDFLKRNQVLKIVYASSISVYGTHSEKICIESSFNTPSVYGLSKLAEEFLIASFENHSIIRFTYLYGKGMKKNSMLPRMVDSAIREKTIKVFGIGERSNDYLHIKDAVSLFIAAGLSKQNSISIGASGISYKNIEVVDLIKSQLRETVVEISGVDNAPSFSFEISNTQQLFNWFPAVTFKDGLTNYITDATAGI